MSQRRTGARFGADSQPVIIHDRVEFPTAAIEGRGVTEREGPGSEEVRHLLNYVMTQLRKGAKRP